VDCGVTPAGPVRELSEAEILGALFSTKYIIS
jgi:hypothetical protein